MAEGNETPGDEPPRRSEGDLLAERRARRASETGEAALTRRAEAAEATVRTLEVHVSTLQERLREVEEERGANAERAEAERAAVLEREAELRRVKQREYAEQQLRVEAEDRMISVDRESRAQLDRLNRRLSASEQEARELAQRLESVQRALAEAEQAAAAERTAARRGERELQARLTELECRALETGRALAAERAARERSERLLESMRLGHRALEGIVGETRAIVGRLAASFADAQAQRRPAPEPPAEPRAPRPQAPAAAPVGEPGAGKVRSGEMADALAAAVERLRARAEEQAPDGIGQTSTAGGRAAAATLAPEAPAVRIERRRVPRPVARPVAPEMPPPASVPTLPRYKHSLSWIGRWRIRRKQRRGR
jgi:chaperonin cofactor prefoldin